MILKVLFQIILSNNTFKFFCHHPLFLLQNIDPAIHDLQIKVLNLLAVPCPAFAAGFEFEPGK
jgi:hypothetical protein